MLAIVLAFPGLRAAPWHATEGVGWVARLEEDWREARDELTAFLALLDEGGFVKPETALCPETEIGRAHV